MNSLFEHGNPSAKKWKLVHPGAITVKTPYILYNEIQLNQKNISGRPAALV
jgi:hypothetical protein